MVELLQSLRALHILFAILWTGAGAYRLLVIERVLADDAAATRFFAHAPHGAFMGATSVGTIVFGGALMGLNSDAYSIEVLGRGAWILGGGMGLAMLAFGVGVLGHVPTDKRLRPIAAARAVGQPHDRDRYAALVAREQSLGRISSSLIAGALVCMLFFRF